MADPSAAHAPDSRPRLWLVRHGETEWARLRRHTGRTDIPLTDAGRRQASELGRRLVGHSFAAVVTSPLSRASETAGLAGFGDRTTFDPDLLEWDYGDDEGRTTAEIREERPGWSIWTHGVRGGESIGVVAARAEGVIARAMEMEGDTLCFAHAHLLRVLGARWIGLPPAAGAYLALSTATISILGWERDSPVVSRWNDGVDLD